jgi:hypothetical protein
MKVVVALDLVFDPGQGEGEIVSNDPFNMDAKDCVQIKACRRFVEVKRRHRLTSELGIVQTQIISFEVLVGLDDVSDVVVFQTLHKPVLKRFELPFHPTPFLEGY